MSRRVATALYLVVMIAIVVTIDVVFLRGSQDTTARLLSNIGIVAVFVGLYFVLFRRGRR